MGNESLVVALNYFISCCQVLKGYTFWVINSATKVIVKNETTKCMIQLFSISFIIFVINFTKAGKKKAVI